MARDDLIQIQGSVSAASGGGYYQVMLENGVPIIARLSGKMKQFKIRIIVGDKVTVSMSPYDASHGIITHRQKA